jgi:hypothetical protein
VGEAEKREREMEQVGYEIDETPQRAYEAAVNP